MIEVTAARIKKDGRFLICKRPLSKRNGGLWEFPGGKIEPGETARDAIRREIREELCIDIEAGEILATVEHDYGDFAIRLMLFDAGIKNGEITLTEHSDARFVTEEELEGYELSPADRELVEMMKKSL